MFDLYTILSGVRSTSQSRFKKGGAKKFGAFLLRTPLLEYLS